MGKLIYSFIGSVDGYVEDATGNFDWAAPDREVHAFVNAAVRTTPCYLYGRRMYETMRVWETDPTIGEHSPESADFAQIWQAADKIVYSTSLPQVTTSKTQLRRRFDPDEVRDLKKSRDDDLAIGGPDLAATALRAGLVDEVHAYLVPEAVGSGKPALPDHRLSFELIDQHTFGNGTVHLRYTCRP